MPCEDDPQCCQQAPALQLPLPPSEGETPTTSCIPGPPGEQGVQGDAGNDGTDGLNAYFPGAERPDEMPAVGDTMEVTFPDAGDTGTIPTPEWLLPGLIVFLSDGPGYYQVVSFSSPDGDPDATAVLRNLGYTGNGEGNIGAGTTDVVPAAPRGADAPPSTRAFIQLEIRAAGGTNGGTFTSGDWRDRSLNQLVQDTDNLLLSHNQSASGHTGVFKLKGGFTYEFAGEAIARGVDRHRCRLLNLADSTNILGTSEFSENSPIGDNTKSEIRGRFTLEVDTEFVLQHRCQTTRSQSGMGVASNFGALEYELYGSLILWAVSS